MEPLATYQQRFGGVAQRFDLHGNYLSVDGRKFGSQFNRRFDLSALNSHFDHGRSRAPLFYGGFVLIGIALVGLAILAVGEIS
jgi:hypothetical protein